MSQRNDHGLEFQPKPTNRPTFKDLDGKTFSRWTVLGYAGALYELSQWWCKCECGTVRKVAAQRLLQGGSKSCGCLQRDRTRKHGKWNTPEYKAWQSMRQRCNNPKDANYFRYGGRGIKVCTRWEESFERFYEDMGPRPSRRHSVGRIDNSGPYSARNCRWETPGQQQVNKRSNRLLTINGESKCISEWSQISGTHHATICGRLRRGLSHEEAVFGKGKFQYLEFNGKKLTIAEWARELGMHEATLRGRIRRGYPVERVLSTEKDVIVNKRSNTIYLTYNGKTQSLVDWAKELGVSRDSLANRHYRNWPVHRILGKPECPTPSPEPPGNN